MVLMACHKIIQVNVSLLLFYKKIFHQLRLNKIFGHCDLNIKTTVESSFKFNKITLQAHEKYLREKICKTLALLSYSVPRHSKPPIVM